MKKLMVTVIVLSLLFRDFFLYQAATLRGSKLWFGLNEQNAILTSQVLFWVVIIALIVYLVLRDRRV